MTLQTDLVVLLPELILAIGAMVLLLTGAIAGEKSASVVSWAPSRFWPQRVLPR